MFGLPVDTKRKYRTRTSNGNSLDPVWDDEIFVFTKVGFPTFLPGLSLSSHPLPSPPRRWCFPPWPLFGSPSSKKTANLSDTASSRCRPSDPVCESQEAMLPFYTSVGGWAPGGPRPLVVGDVCSASVSAGFHYINLKNELNQPLLLPSLLVYTEAQDYIPNEHQGRSAPCWTPAQTSAGVLTASCVSSEYAEALTNPIKHVSQLHKRETQLAVLLEDNSEVGTAWPQALKARRPGSHSCARFSSTSPSSPRTESPGGRAKRYREAPPPSTSSRSTRWTTPPTSSSCRSQVAPSCCLGNQELSS